MSAATALLKSDEKTFIVVDESQQPRKQTMPWAKRVIMATAAFIIVSLAVGAVVLMMPCRSGQVGSPTPDNSNTTVVSKVGLNVNCGTGCSDCCSQHGYCGSSAEHCGYGCQADLSGAGKCAAGVLENISNNGRCGIAAAGAKCPESLCCSQWQWCGDSVDHCLASKNCNPLLGKCWESEGDAPKKEETGSTSVTVTEGEKKAPAKTESQAAETPRTQAPPATGGSGGYDRSSTLTWYTYGGAPNYCEGRTRAESDLVVAMSTGMLNARGDCRRQISSIEIYSPSTRRSVRAQVVDMCDESHGCRPNVVDGTRGIWAALGIDLAQGVHQIQWKWL